MRATGRLHLGNYLGGALGMVELQNNPEYETFYMVADVHCITTPYAVSELRESRKDVIIDYLAVGLDPDKSTIFVQSMVPTHLELQFYLSSVITVARMQHLPTYKEKVAQYPTHVTMALLNYPVLMAADILAYKAHKVPVGIDQEPHLEAARQIARNVNEIYGTDFPEPVRFATKGSYVPSLLGEGKMSKTVEGSYINLTDSLDTIKAKLAKTPTDEGRGTKVPERGHVANLFTFVELFMGEDTRKDYEHAYTTSKVSYKDLKEKLGNAIYEKLKPIQEKRLEVASREGYVEDVINEGAKKALEVTQRTLSQLKEKMGF